MISRFRPALMAALFMVAVPSSLNADIVMFEFYNNDLNRVTGRIVFNHPDITRSAGWEIPSGTLLSSFTNGGLSGISWDFGTGLINAVSGDLVVNSGTGIDSAGSFTGSDLDFGSFAQFGNGGITFSDGNRIITTGFTDSTDTVRHPFSNLIRGEWRATNVPEPSAFVCMGIGLLLISSRHRPARRH
ncbi:MAG: hypothetical protein AAFN77_24105 [Planctomycetota bacterium]